MPPAGPFGRRRSWLRTAADGRFRRYRRRDASALAFAEPKPEFALRTRCAQTSAVRSDGALGRYRDRVSDLCEMRTERLLLRRWKPSDRPALAALNADPAVMRYFPGTLSAAQTDHFIDVVDARFEVDGFGIWAVEAGGELVGFTGLSRPGFEAAFAPAVEVSWRLARHAWGHGYATEAASLVLDDAFSRLGLREVVAYTTPVNLPSRAVMQRLGMTHDPGEDFDHPRLPPASPLRRHVLYRMSAERWHSST